MVSGPKLAHTEHNAVNNGMGERKLYQSGFLYLTAIFQVLVGTCTCTLLGVQRRADQKYGVAVL
jgi:L-arabinose isomerase